MISAQFSTIQRRIAPITFINHVYAETHGSSFKITVDTIWLLSRIVLSESELKEKLERIEINSVDDFQRR